MTNLWMFFLFCYILMTIVSMFFERNGGVAATSLTAALDEEATVINVNTTSGFLGADVLLIGDEKICYSSTTSTTFTVSQRGCQGTSPAPHSGGARVYNEGAGLINQAIGFNLIQVIADDGFFIGGIKAVVNLPSMLSFLVSKLVLWDYAWLQDGPMIYVRYVMYTLSGGLVISLALTILRRG